MKSHQGLKKIKKTLRSGGTRSYWVRAQSGAKKIGRAVMRHKGKILVGAAVVAGAAYAGRKIHQNREHRANQQAAYEAFKKVWPDFTSHVRAKKSETARAGGPPPKVSHNYRTEFTGSTEGRNRRDQSLRANLVTDSNRRWGSMTKTAPLHLGSGSQTPHEEKLWAAANTHYPGSAEHHRGIAAAHTAMADRHVAEGFPNAVARNRIEARYHERTAAAKAAGTHQEPRPPAPRKPKTTTSRPRKKK